VTKDILAALVQLDTDVDAHWTTDGSPRLEALQEILGRVVKRVEVSAAAPLFKRDNLQLPEHGAPEIKDETDGQEAAAEADEGEREAPAEAVQGREEGLSELDSAEAALAAANAQLAAAQVLLAKAQAERDRKLAEAEKAGADPHANQKAIMTYLAGQQRMREERGVRAEALRAAGIGPAMLDVRARIDAALARKRGHGQNRPAR